MIRKIIEDSVTTAARLWSRPVWCKQSSISSTLVAHSKPRVVQPVQRRHAWFICSRFHHTCTSNKDVSFLGHQSFLHTILPTSVLPTNLLVRCSSTLQKQPEEEPDTLYKWIDLKCKGHDDSVLNSYEKFVFMAAKELGVHIESVSKPKRTIQKLTLLKSRHIFKKHRVQYEMRTFFRVITLKHLTGSTADVFLEYVERNLSEGVAMQVHKCHLEKIPDHLTAHYDDETTHTANEDETNHTANDDETTHTANEDLLSSSSSSDSSSDSDSSSSDEDVKETLLSNENKPLTPS